MNVTLAWYWLSIKIKTRLKALNLIKLKMIQY